MGTEIFGFVSDLRNMLSVGRMNYLFLLAVFSYTVNVAIGITARLRIRKFGKLHHVNYFITFFFTVLAAAIDFHLLFIIPVVTLAILPRFRGWGFWHPVTAGTGYLTIITMIFHYRGAL